ncbi:MAG: TIR domain-containing protein [Phycisphaerales bacterium JB052]
MPTDIYEVENVFDRLSDDVTRSNYTEFHNAITIFVSESKELEYFSEVISEIPAVDIPGLIQEAGTPGRRGTFPWPTTNNEKFACRWNLLVEMTKEDPAISPYDFAYRYLGDTSNRYDDMLYTFVDKVFYPVIDELRLRSRKIYDSHNKHAPDLVPLPLRDMKIEHTHDSPLFFISHSSKDKELAHRLVQLIQHAFSLKSSDIRCTSVPGFTHPTGSNTDDWLRTETIHCQCLIALVTPRSITSPYVIFELGARWGTQKPLFPVVGHGLAKGNLPSPLNAINAKNLANRDEVLDLVDDIESSINLPKDKLTVWEQYMDELVQTASEIVETETTAETAKEQDLNENEIAILRFLSESEDSGVTVTISTFKALNLPRSKLKYHLDNLEEVKLVSVSHSILSRVPSKYRLTRSGRQYLHTKIV